VLRFQDANFGVAKKRMIDFCEGLLRKGLNINWNGTIEIKQICQYDWDTLKLMKRSGTTSTGSAPSPRRKRPGLMRKGIKDGPDRRGHAPHARARHQVGPHLHHRLPRRDRGVDVPDHLRGGGHEDPLPSCSVEVFPYRPIPGSEFWKPRVEQNAYPCHDLRAVGQFFDYKFNSGGAWCRPRSRRSGRVHARWRPGFSTALRAWPRGLPSRGLLRTSRRGVPPPARNRSLRRRPSMFQAFDLRGAAKHGAR
jgi:hypothetical protein